jgi:hypothetical protein
VTISEHWEQFSAYAGIIADAKRRGREEAVQNKWEDPLFHEGRRWGRMEREAHILDTIQTHIRYDDWGNPSIPNVEELLKEIKGENK